MRVLSATAALLAAFLVCSCGGAKQETPDAGLEACPEATQDAPLEAGADAHRELVPDFRADATSDAAVDAVSDDVSDLPPDVLPDLGSDLAAEVQDEVTSEEVADLLEELGHDAATDLVADLPPDVFEPPLCLVGPQNVSCAHETTTLLTGLSGLVPRDVHWQTPAGAPPEGGWPAVILFQGSFLPAGFFWSVFDGAPFGMWHQVLLVKSLLEAGFAVITPEAHAGGGMYWDTNIPPHSFIWETAPDHYFMLDILVELDAGTFGPVDTGRLYAGGISSGGYMTSRMAVSYPGKFKALAIQSASYATCAGPTCLVPALPADHPPTLFLHGELDTVVPILTMLPYATKLVGQGTETTKEIDAGAGHEWLESAPDVVVDWFLAYP